MPAAPQEPLVDGVQDHLVLLNCRQAADPFVVGVNFILCGDQANDFCFASLGEDIEPDEHGHILRMPIQIRRHGYIDDQPDECSGRRERRLEKMNAEMSLPSAPLVSASPAIATAPS